MSEKIFVNENGSYCHNCYVEKAKDRFLQVGEPLCLNGYAIIPLEIYQELTGKDVQSMIDQANEMEDQILVQHAEILESLKE